MYYLKYTIYNILYVDIMNSMIMYYLKHTTHITYDILDVIDYMTLYYTITASIPDAGASGSPPASHLRADPGVRCAGDGDSGRLIESP